MCEGAGARKQGIKKRGRVHRRVDVELIKKRTKLFYGKRLKIDFAFGVKEALGGRQRGGLCDWVHVCVSAHELHSQTT